ncbi:MAG: peptide chain release factor N(5)-glutamine methyltransferase [Spirochaetaceae bacterium]|jgi:release factor glutamine methyltransferase|nr:peptide chain release factor N(5)-glutamine methyltransferase [Spirochaetaceae bacterium]
MSTTVIQELLSKGTALLASKNISAPALDAALLLANVTSLSREKLYTHANQEVCEEQCKLYFELLERRQNGECTAYITGHKEFWGLDFSVTPAVLVPRPDTEILVETALAMLRPLPTASVLDLCTGCGAVAIALKHESSGTSRHGGDGVCRKTHEKEVLTAAQRHGGREERDMRSELDTTIPPSVPPCPSCRRVKSSKKILFLQTHVPCMDVWAADISEEALKIAHHNADTLGCAITFLQGDLFEPLKNTAEKRFHLITANAPYVVSACIESLAAEVRREPRIALDGGDDGLAVIRRIIKEAPLYLEAEGALLLEADPSQMAAIAALMKERGFRRIETYCDYSGQERVIAGICA